MILCSCLYSKPGTVHPVNALIGQFYEVEFDVFNRYVVKLNQKALKLRGFRFYVFIIFLAFIKIFVICYQIKVAK